MAKIQFLGSFPRYAVEALGMVAIALLGGLLLGALALGAQLLLPALQ